MPKPNSKARTLVASILCAVAFFISAPALAGSHSAYVKTIDERATKLGCSLIGTNRNFSMITNGLKLAGYSPEEFFLNASCWLRLTSSTREELKPLKFAIADPSSRRVQIEHFMRYLDELNDPEFTRHILNQIDHGMTTLDYLDFMYHESFSRDFSAQRDLDALRREFCKRGGVYQSRTVNC